MFIESEQNCLIKIVHHLAYKDEYLHIFLSIFFMILLFYF